jgi:hypothetical protein
LSVQSGSAGATITIIGQNFSGAAGRLQVLFGGTRATNVTVVDDGHVTATVPTGTGSVDVRIQSGVTTSPDPSNYRDPIFGYGISAVTSNDRFTYTGGTDQPPTVAQPAAANPNPVNGTTTALSVLGADDGGEASLIYTWTATAAPSGAHPTFSANGTNAAKNSTVTFDRAGSYTFQASITDQAGLSVTSSVAVIVDQTLTRITVTPPSVTLRRGYQQQFVASAFDQFGQSMAGSQTYTWSLVSGIGTITSTGLYKAPKQTGSAVIQASSGGVSARATITITATGTSTPLVSEISRLLRNPMLRKTMVDLDSNEPS